MANDGHEQEYEYDYDYEHDYEHEPCVTCHPARRSL